MLNKEHINTISVVCTKQLRLLAPSNCSNQFLPVHDIYRLTSLSSGDQDGGVESRDVVEEDAPHCDVIHCTRREPCEGS